MESVCAGIFTILLLLPLILQLQILMVDPRKLFKIFHYYATSGVCDNGDRESTPKLFQHYPKTPILFDTGSDSKVTLARLRTICSSPALSHELSVKKDDKPDKTILPEARHSSAFVKTSEVLPVVDITWTYDSYRYKTFQESLRGQYGNNYPPGRVVLNSMQLNLSDPRGKVAGNISGGLFDFIKESDVALDGPVSRKLEIEYLNPLDHFVMRQLERPLTEEKFTETPREPEDGPASPYNGKGVESSIGPAITPRERDVRFYGNQRALKAGECVQNPGSTSFRGCNLSSRRKLKIPRHG